MPDPTPLNPIPPDPPEGLVELPGSGLGAHYRPGALRWRWGAVAVLVLTAVVMLATTARLLHGLADLITVLVVVVVLALTTTMFAVGALHGSAPVLTIDDDYLTVHTPFNRARVRLDAITKVTVLRRDLLIEAAGGIERRGRATRARWLPIEGASGLSVERAALADYLRRRAGLIG